SRIPPYGERADITRVTPELQVVGPRAGAAVPLQARAVVSEERVVGGRQAARNGQLVRVVGKPVSPSPAALASALVDDLRMNARPLSNEDQVGGPPADPLVSR